jgi:hypothetical protein
MKLKLGVFCLLLIMIPISVAADVTTANSTMRAVTDIAYPIELFYGIFVTGLICLGLDILWITRIDKIPPTAIILTSIIGFIMFTISSYMVPYAAKIVVVASSTEVRSVSNYVLSPPIVYLCMGLAAISFVLIWYGVIRLWQVFAANQKYLNDPDHQFEMYMRDW